MQFTDAEMARMNALVDSECEKYGPCNDCPLDTLCGCVDGDFLSNPQQLK